MNDIKSQYPEKPDPMLFFQDNSLDKQSVINTYNNLIAEGKYDEANELVSQHDNLYGYFADYFNSIENRIYSLQEYLLTKQKKELIKHSNTEPAQMSENMIWIE